MLHFWNWTKLNKSNILLFFVLCFVKIMNILFVEEEWEDDVTVFVPGGETEDDMANGDGSCEKNDNVQVLYAFPYVCMF